jgi:hypothetical protein
MIKRLLTLVVLSAAPVTGLAETPQHPDLAGVWVLSTTRSTVAQQGIRAGRLRIDHQGLQLRFHRTFVTAEGGDDLSWVLTTDGVEKTTRSEGVTTHSRLFWEGDQLVLDEKLELPGRTATNVVRYSLTDEGRTLIAKEAFRGPRLQYDNTWVFERR